MLTRYSMQWVIYKCGHYQMQPWIFKWTLSTSSTRIVRGTEIQIIPKHSVFCKCKKFFCSFWPHIPRGIYVRFCSLSNVQQQQQHTGSVLIRGCNEMQCMDMTACKSAAAIQNMVPIELNPTSHCPGAIEASCKLMHDYVSITRCDMDSVTRSGDLLDIGQLFKAFGNSFFCPNLPHS